MHMHSSTTMRTTYTRMSPGGLDSHLRDAARRVAAAPRACGGRLGRCGSGPTAALPCCMTSSSGSSSSNRRTKVRSSSAAAARTFITKTQRGGGMMSHGFCGGVAGARARLPHRSPFAARLAASATSSAPGGAPSPRMRDLLTEREKASRAAIEDGYEELLPDEQRVVRLFQDNSASVVGVATSTDVFSIFSLDALEIPRGVGSGFIWDNKGHVVTNAHVVESSGKVAVTLQGNTEPVKATVVGRERDKDVAVLRLDIPKDQMEALRPVSLGSSSRLLVGQTVYALGNPFGLDLSLTRGVVSGLGREIGSRRSPITNVIQTDAAINPGNSGGPLLDSRGRLVGINTAILDPTGSGAFSGVGFAIPIDAVKGMVDQILISGRVLRPALGVTITPVPARPAARGQLASPGEGVLVVAVRTGGPADVAGIQPTKREMFGRIVLGDVIRKISGVHIRSQADMYAALDSCRVGDIVDVELAPRDVRNVWPPVAAQPGRNGGTSTAGRTVRVVLADREKMQWRGD